MELSKRLLFRPSMVSSDKMILVFLCMYSVYDTNYNLSSFKREVSPRKKRGSLFG